MESMSHQAADDYPFNGESIFLRSLHSTVRIYLEERKPLPEFLSNGIHLLGLTIRRTVAEAAAMNDEGVHMTETQIKTFWDQVFAFAFLNHCMPVPTEEEAAALHEYVDELANKSERGEITDDTLEDEYLETDTFARQQKIILEYFAHLVTRFGRSIPVPESVRSKLRSANPEEADDDLADGEREVAVCNCPYCWAYMEDLPRFMDHLWERHAVVDGRMEESNRNMDEKKEEEEAQDRKDSGYGEMLPSEGHEKMDVPQRRRPETVVIQPGETNDLRHTTSDPTPSSSTFNIQFWKGVLEPPLWKDQSQLKTTSATNQPRAARLEAYWDEERRAQQVRENVTPIWWFDPYKKDNAFKSKARPGSLGEGRLQEDQGQRTAGEYSYSMSRYLSMEEKVEVQIPPPSPSPKKRKLPGQVASEVSALKPSFSDKTTENLFKLPTLPASRMKKPIHERPVTDNTTNSLFPPSSSSGPTDNTDDEERHWICAHDQGCCAKRFDSLVLYVEHLSTHGYIVYRPWTALPRSVFPSTSRCLRTAWGTSL